MKKFNSKIFALAMCFTAISDSYALDAEVGFSKSQGVSESTASDTSFSLMFEDKSKLYSKYDSHFEAKLKFYSGAEEPVFSVPEAKLSYEDRENYYSFGKEIIDWNSSEKYWTMGQINGKQNFSLLDDTQEGLVGIRLRNKISRNSFDFFASYVYVPNLNPGTKVENGEIISSAPWVISPPSKIRVENRLLGIYYELEVPKTQDIVFQPSLGGEYKRHWKKGSASIYTLYKPENDLRVNSEGYLGKNLDFVNVTAKPFVNHHLLYGASVDQRINDIHMHVGGLVVDPKASLNREFLSVDPQELEELRNFNSDYFAITPTYTVQTTVFSSVYYKSEILVFGVNHILDLSDEESGDDFYGDSIKWHNAVGFDTKYAFNDSFSGVLNLKYDFEKKDNVLKSEIQYGYKNTIKVALGVEFLKSESKDSYWSDYKYNDTIYSNFSYAF